MENGNAQERSRYTMCGIFVTRHQERDLDIPKRRRDLMTTIENDLNVDDVLSVLMVPCRLRRYG